MYTFKNTEQNNLKASDLETKSLLYLLGIHKEKKNIETIAVDCFNDITGLCDKSIRLWDVQSKNHSVLNPKKIGKSLSTLFDNFESPFDFHDYILFIPKVNPNYLIDSKLHVYGMANFESKTHARIEKGLNEEYRRVNSRTPSKTSLASFLNIVTIVQDNRQSNSYIKELTKFKSNRIKDEDFYASIFKEIRDVQSSKKNSSIEGKSIKKISDVLTFNRHLHKKEIHTLIINRFVGGDLFSDLRVPLPFLNVINQYDDEQDQKDLMIDCNANICRSFFDKNNNSKFWRLTESIIIEINRNSDQTINEIYDNIQGDNIKAPFMNRESILLLISIIKHGWGS